MTCNHEFFPSPDDNEYGGSSISLNDDGSVSCALCGKRWVET